MKYIIAIVASLLLAGCAPANSSDAPRQAAPAADQAASALEKTLAGKGVTITGGMEAPEGFHGFVGNYRGRPLPVYILPDGKHFVVGSLYDMQGNDLTSAAMRRAVESRLGKAQWEQLAQATSFVAGNPEGKRIVYAFMDTECPFCHKYWQNSQPWLDKTGDVQMRIILVAVISPESLPGAAAILDAGDPLAAWKESERHFGNDAKPGHAPSAGALRKIRANNALMNAMGFYGTPSIVYKDAAGSIHALQGMPPDPASLRAVYEG